jgi:hypothetical protein
MVGDVNIYMNDPDDMQLAEIEIMIAEHKRYLLYNTDHATVITILLTFTQFCSIGSCIYTFLLGSK